MLLKSALIGFVCTLSASAWAAEGETQQAAWKSYDLDFPYMGSTTVYSCTGIENRLEQILKQLGARSDVRVTGLSCAGDRPTKAISTRIKASLPSTSEGEGEKFPVKATTVTLNARSDGIGSGDCELLEQFRDRVVPKLGLKAVGDDLRCIPRQAPTVAGTLRVAALIPEKAAEKSK
jgi:hypothetical protein